MITPTITRTEVRSNETFDMPHCILSCSVAVVDSRLVSVVAQATAKVEGPQGEEGRGYGSLSYQNGKVRCEIPLDSPTADVFADFVAVLSDIIRRENTEAR